MTNLYHPLCSLKEGRWFKLICGASFQHLPAVRNLTLAYTLAGADCIDVAADPAVIVTAREAIQTASAVAASAPELNFRAQGLPWLMVSLNDGEDPHFRKAEFDPTRCPSDCHRPCESICPAQAIAFDSAVDGFSGVLNDRCYGCGRCLPICPIGQIITRSHVFTPEAIAPLVLQGVDAVEIHTQVGRLADFRRLWQAIAPWVHQLKLVAVSCPDGDGLIDYLWALHETMAPLPCALVWQTDGRPMSGDIGDGTTRAAVKLGQKVLAAHLPGFVQLAGGTNRHTVAKLQSLGLLNLEEVKTEDQPIRAPVNPCLTASAPSSNYIAGVAYGSYARVLLSPVLERLETLAIPEVTSISPFLTSQQGLAIAGAEVKPRSAPRLEDYPELLQQAVHLAHSLVYQIKAPTFSEPVVSYG